MKVFWILVFFTDTGYGNDTISMRFEQEVECRAAFDVLSERYHGGWGTQAAARQSDCLRAEVSR